MRYKKNDLKNKIKRVDMIKNKLEISLDVSASLEDLNDAIVLAKVEKTTETINEILEQLSKSKTKQEYDTIYEELEKNEEILYLLTKKYSKNYQKAKKEE